MQLLRKLQSQFTRLDQQQMFFRQILNLKIFFCTRVHVRVQKNYFFKFEFGKITKVFRVQVRVCSPGVNANYSITF